MQVSTLKNASKHDFVGGVGGAGVGGVDGAGGVAVGGVGDGGGDALWRSAHAVFPVCRTSGLQT